MMTTKKTKQGIVVKLNGCSVIKIYSKHYMTCITFTDNISAKKEFGKLRKDHKSI